MTAWRTLWRAPAALPERLGLLAFGLLWLLAVALSAHTYTVLADSRAAGDGARARLMAQALGQRVDRALALGIPLRQLVGVPELLQQRLAAHPDVRAIVLRDAGGQVLWQASARGGELLGARLPLLALPEASAQVPVGEGAGTVQLVVRSPDLIEFMRSLALPLTLGCAFFALLAWLAARAARDTTRRARDRAVLLAQRDIAAQRYDRLTVTLHRRGFDLRAQQLARGVRAAHEMLVRARRVVSSLRRTEPHPARREWLDHLLGEAEGEGRFADTASPRLRRVVGADAEAAWTLLLLACAAGAALGLTLAGALVLEWPPAALALAFAAAWPAAGAGWWLARRSHVPAVLVASAAAAAIALAPWLPAMLDARQAGWGLLLCALGAGTGLGAALAACVSVQRTARQRPDLLPLGRRAWSAPAAAAIGLFALGPAWAGLCWMVAPGRAWLPLAPGAVALLAALGVWRWNAARSPWRTRTRAGAPAGGRATAATVWGAVLAGLLAGGVALLPWTPGPMPSADGADGLPAVAVVGAALLAALGLALGLWLGRPAAAGRAARRTGAAVLIGGAFFAVGAMLAALLASGVIGVAASPAAGALAWGIPWDWLAAALQLLAAPALAVAVGLRLRRAGGAACAAAGIHAATWPAALGVLAIGGWLALQPALVQALRPFAPVGESPVVQATPGAGATLPAPRPAAGGKAGHGT